jgi:hypothetical protein
VTRRLLRSRCTRDRRRWRSPVRPCARRGARSPEPGSPFVNAHPGKGPSTPVGAAPGAHRPEREGPASRAARGSEAAARDEHSSPRTPPAHGAGRVIHSAGRPRSGRRGPRSG